MANRFAYVTTIELQYFIEALSYFSPTGQFFKGDNISIFIYAKHKAYIDGYIIEMKIVSVNQGKGVLDDFEMFFIFISLSADGEDFYCKIFCLFLRISFGRSLRI